MPARSYAAALLLATTFGFCAFPAVAGPLVEAATRAEKLAIDGNPVGAHDAVREAYGAFASTLPFSIGKVTFVTDPPEGYGMYSPRPTSTYKPGEPLISYVEPVGLSWRSIDGGKVEAQFTVDLELLNNKGDTLAEQKAFGSFTFRGFVRNQEVFAKLTLNVEGPPAGDYVLRYRFRDALSGAVALSDQSFSIAP
ncbi:hypothetical protein IB238_05380 [Rhizobium sp. ARZ01]|uniref:hypothetical protein n=1 Tax=Rhizobium sp. ARZ01 TaxID=2769313 RepID=UPI0017872115|nr:hypothetical protein [Rhizobium sp. ARZ01]MBD9372062.1 hypothetical protein [Rhizobium sp. ARZ01]